MAFDKRKLKREIEKERRANVKARMAELTELIRDARRARRDAVKGVQLDCRAAREALRNSCALRRAAAREDGAREILGRQLALAGERRDEKALREADRRGMRKRSTAKERRKESDDEVRANLEPWAVEVFDRVKRHIKATPGRRTRTEAFLEWMHDNPEEVYAIRNQEADRELARYLAEQARLEQLSRRRGSLEGVPF